MNPLIQQAGAQIIRSAQTDPNLSGRQVELVPRQKESSAVRRFAGSLTPYPFVPGLPGAPGGYEAAPAISQRFKAPGLLFLGSTFGLAAFFFVFTIRLITFSVEVGNDALEKGYKFPSGYGYWPGTVSEGVSDAYSPQGKIFFGGCLASVITYFVSFYPFNLRNVYAGPDTLKICGCCPVYWNSFRQYFPTLGLLIVICVSTYPAPVAADSAGQTMQFCVVLHLVGAAMMFPGYMTCELKCLHMYPFKQVARGYTSIEGPERALRQILIVIMILFFTLFCLMQGIMMLPISEEALCCYDKYLNKGDNFTMTDGRVVQFEEPQLLNTSEGWPLVFKMTSYLSECVAGVALLLSHLCVWYYCEERLADYCQPFLELVVDEELTANLQEEYDFEEDDF